MDISETLPKMAQRSTSRKVPAANLNHVSTMIDAVSNTPTRKRKSSYGRPITHGLTVNGIIPKEYTIWSNMRDRCNNPKNTKFQNYGGRGIKVCDRWNDFAKFIEDMGPRPTGLTIEREDSNGNYEPSNCRWATWTEQQRNRSTNHMVSCGGDIRCVSEWSERTGIPYRTILSRLASGWTEEDAVTLPNGSSVKKNNVMVEWDGRVKSVCAWAKEIGVNPIPIYGRIKRGWSIRDALFGRK